MTQNEWTLSGNILGLIKQNCVVVLLSAFGLFTFGVTSVLTLVSSGAVFGGVASVAYQGGLRPSQIFLVSVPHSLELLGLWLAGSIGFMGLRLPLDLLQDGIEELRSEAGALALLVALSLVLTVVAAVIEAKFTLGILVDWV